MKKTAVGTEGFRKEFMALVYKPLVYKTDERMECWPWMGNRQITPDVSRQYGYLMRSKKHLKAHRIMWELMGFPAIPEDFCIMHLCPFGYCVNPNHIVMGFDTANNSTADLEAKLVFGKNELLDKFLRLVDRTGGMDNHWPWMGARQKTGAESRSYGDFWPDRQDKKTRCKAHHMMWKSIGGPPIPIGIEILHTCDRGWCVNPTHLRMGTHYANVIDGVFKKRHGIGRLPDQPVPPTHPYLLI